MSRIVIIGGMGPQASLYFHRLIIDNFAEHGAKNNADYPEIIHLSIPVPDYIASGDSSEALQMLERELADITFSKDDKVFLTCNTVHSLKVDLEEIIGVKIISLMETVETYLISRPLKGNKVGLLASPTTLATGLYSDGLENEGYEIIVPDANELNNMESAIRGVIANKDPKTYVNKLSAINTNLFGKGAECIILGCTEISLIFSGVSDETLIDPLQICIDRYINADELVLN